MHVRAQDGLMLTASCVFFEYEYRAHYSDLLTLKLLWCLNLLAWLVVEPETLLHEGAFACRRVQGDELRVMGLQVMLKLPSPL